VRLRKLSKAYGGLAAVDGISFDVPAGAFVSLLGPSGSGKTTTLNLIAGFLTPDSGDILIDERSVADVPPHKRNIGMVFQSYSLFPHMTVADNVGFPLRMRSKLSRQAAQKRIVEMLALVQLSHLGARYPRQLSGGQQQRVAMARALVSAPRLLLMDEPLGALDKKLREQMQAEIRRIHRSVGTTVVYVTHDQSEALTMSDLVVVMHHGRIAQIGTPREIYFQPKNRFVAEFIGAANIIEAALENGHLVLPGGRQPIGGDATLPAALAMIRPETIRVVEAGNAPLSGTVDSVSFIGDRQRMVVSGASGKPLTVDAPNTIKAQAGERVGLSIAPDAIRLLPPEK